MYRYSRLSTSISPQDGPATMSPAEKAMGRSDSLEKEGRVTEVEETRGAAAAEGRLLEEKRLVRKLDMRIMPIACILYLFACELS